MHIDPRHAEAIVKVVTWMTSTRGMLVLVFVSSIMAGHYIGRLSARDYSGWLELTWVLLCGFTWNLTVVSLLAALWKRREK